MPLLSPHQIDESHGVEQSVAQAEQYGERGPADDGHPGSKGNLLPHPLQTRIPSYRARSYG